MKKYLILSTAILALALFVNNSSAQDNPLFRHISPEASSIFHINLPLLASKISWSDLMTHIPTEKVKSKDQQWLELMKEPSRTGLDFKGDILFTHDADLMYDFTTVIVHMADTSKFRILLRKQFHGLRISRYPDKSYSAFKSIMGFAWNKDFAILVMVKPTGHQGESGSGSQPPNYEAMTVSKCIHALKGWDSPPIMNDPAFKEAFSNDADFQMYSEKTNYYKGLEKIIPHGLLGNLNWDSLMFYKNSYCAVWFANGKITAHCATTLQPQVAADMERMPPPALNPDLVARLPKGDLLGLASIRLNLGMIPYVLNRIGLGKTVDSIMAAQNISMNDLSHALKGDLLLAVTAPAPAEPSQKPKPAVYAVLSVNDPASLDKFAEMLRKAKDSVSKASPDGSGDSTKKATPIGKMKNNFVVKDNILVVSGSKEMAESYFAKTEKMTTDPQLLGQLKDNPTLIWIDMGAIVNLFLGPASSDEGADAKMKMLNGLHVLDKMIISKSGLHDGKITSEIVFSVTKKDQNILKTILDLIPEFKPRAPQH